MPVYKDIFILQNKCTVQIPRKSFCFTRYILFYIGIISAQTSGIWANPDILLSDDFTTLEPWVSAPSSGSLSLADAVDGSDFGVVSNDTADKKWGGIKKSLGTVNFDDDVYVQIHCSKLDAGSKSFFVRANYGGGGNENAKSLIPKINATPGLYTVNMRTEGGTVWSGEQDNVWLWLASWGPPGSTAAYDWVKVIKNPETPFLSAGVPTGLTPADASLVNPADAYTITLGWDPVDGADAYTVLYSVSPKFPPGKTVSLLDSVTNNSLNLDPEFVSQLNVGDTIYWKVAAKQTGSILNSNFSSVHSVQINLDPLEILMIGNSYTNDSKDELNNLLVASGIQYHLQAHNPNGVNFHNHSTSETVKNLLNSREWDVVVLQDQSAAPASAAHWYRNWPHLVTEYSQSAKSMAELVYATNPETRIVWFSTPAYYTGSQYYPGIYDDMDDMREHTSFSYNWYKDNYSNANSQVAETGKAFILSYGEDPNRALHRADLSHHTSTGQYLIACVLFDTITKRSSKDLIDDSSVTQSDKLNLQLIAKQVSQAESTVWGNNNWYYDSVLESVTPMSDSIPSYMPLADDDNDGIVSLLELALGGDMTSSDTSSMLLTIRIDGGNFEMSFLRNNNTMTYRIHSSTDLVDWSTVEAVIKPFDDVSTPYILSIPISAKKYLRLEVID